MERWRLSALSIDREIARTIARHGNPQIEFLAKVFTCLADERFLLPIWQASRAQPEPRRSDAGHLLLTMAVTAAVPHL